MKMTPKKLEAELREYAMRYPDVTEDFPWGERAIKIRKKAFIFMRATDHGVSLSVKLPQSRDMAIDFPWASPTHYGLGKHGWVTAELDLKKNPPVDLIKKWIDESFRAVAPKKVVKELDASLISSGNDQQSRRKRR